MISCEANEATVYHFNIGFNRHCLLSVLFLFFSLGSVEFEIKNSELANDLSFTYSL